MTIVINDSMIYESVKSVNDYGNYIVLVFEKEEDGKLVETKRDIHFLDISKLEMKL